MIESRLKHFVKAHIVSTRKGNTCVGLPSKYTLVVLKEEETVPAAGSVFINGTLLTGDDEIEVAYTLLEYKRDGDEALAVYEFTVENGGVNSKGV